MAPGPDSSGAFRTLALPSDSFEVAGLTCSCRGSGSPSHLVQMRSQTVTKGANREGWIDATCGREHRAVADPDIVKAKYLEVTIDDAIS